MTKKILNGKVIKDKNNKTVVVLVKRKYIHPFFKKVINSSSNFSNPSEVANLKVVHQLQRNSGDNIKNWKKRLNNKDINKVRDLTEHLSQSFYSEKDW